jgi:hypothetical protein
MRLSDHQSHMHKVTINRIHEVRSFWIWNSLIVV